METRVERNGSMMMGGSRGGGGSGAATTAQERMERERERERERRARLGKSSAMLGSQVSGSRGGGGGGGITQSTLASTRKERPRSLQQPSMSSLAGGSSSASAATTTPASFNGASASSTARRANHAGSNSSGAPPNANLPPTPGPKTSAVNANYHRRRAATTATTAPGGAGTSSPSSSSLTGLGLVMNTMHRDVVNNQQIHNSNINRRSLHQNSSTGNNSDTSTPTAADQHHHHRPPHAGPPPTVARSGRKETPRPPHSNYPPPPPPVPTRRNTVIHLPTSSSSASAPSKTAPNTPLKSSFAERQKLNSPRNAIPVPALSVAAAYSPKTSPTTTAPPPLPDASSPQSLPSPSTAFSPFQRRQTSAVTPTTTTPVAAISVSPPAQTTLQPPPAQPVDTRALTPPRQNSSRSPSPTNPDSRRVRSPARFSSNGVATSTGPPPALSYRQPAKMERTYSEQSTRESRSSNSSSSTARPSHARKDSMAHSRDRRAMSVDDYSDEEDEKEDKDRTIRGLEDLQKRQMEREAGGVSIDRPEGGEQGEEDVFLRLARTTSITSQAGRVERKRARLSQYQNVRNSLPAPEAHEMNSSPPQASEEAWRQHAHLSSPIDYRARRISTQSESNGEERASITPRQNLSTRPLSLLRRERSPASAGSGGHLRSFSMVDSGSRTRTIPQALPGRQVQSFNESLKSPIDLPPEYAHDDDNEGSEHGGSQSSVSTSAASVWDELDDLKSRIRRLEVTGRMPASGSNSSGERPRTATTTITTMSSSPRRKEGSTGINSISPAGSTFSVAPSAAAHPLLHAAVTKVKHHISPEVYKHLESASNDALSLAALVGAPGTGTPATFAGDRQARRKVDSMCRSLTELSLALSDTRPNPTLLQSPLQPHRPASRDRSTTRDSIFSGRESVLETRRRFADRKGSLTTLSSYPTPPALNPSATIRHRNSLIIKSHRTGDESDDDRSRFRAPSRATTEVNRRSITTPRRYTQQQNSFSSPTAPPSRRFFSADRDELHHSPLSRSVREERTLPISERLTAALDREEEYEQNRIRSASIGRRVARGLRESVDLGGEREGGARFGVRR